MEETYTYYIKILIIEQSKIKSDSFIIKCSNDEELYVSYDYYFTTKTIKYDNIRYCFEIFDIIKYNNYIDILKYCYSKNIIPNIILLDEQLNYKKHIDEYYGKNNNIKIIEINFTIDENIIFNKIFEIFPKNELQKNKISYFEQLSAKSYYNTYCSIS